MQAGQRKTPALSPAAFEKSEARFVHLSRVKKSVIVVCALSCRCASARRHLYYTKRTNYSPISQFSFFKTVFQTVLRELQIVSKSYFFHVILVDFESDDWHCLLINQFLTRPGIWEYTS